MYASVFYMSTQLSRWDIHIFKLVNEFNDLNFQAVIKNLPTTNLVMLHITLQLCFHLLTNHVGTQCAFGCWENSERELKKWIWIVNKLRLEGVTAGLVALFSVILQLALPLQYIVCKNLLYQKHQHQIYPKSLCLKMCHSITLFNLVADWS